MEFDQIKRRSKTKRCRKCRNPAWSPVKLSCVSAVKKTGTEPGPESPGIATVALLAEARGGLFRQIFARRAPILPSCSSMRWRAERSIFVAGGGGACLMAKKRRVYTARGHGFARVKAPGFVFTAVQLERPRMIADGS